MSWTLLALAAVGLERRSKIPPPPAVEARDSGRLCALAAGATEGRDGRVAAGFVAGRVAVEGLRVIFWASSP